VTVPLDGICRFGAQWSTHVHHLRCKTIRNRPLISARAAVMRKKPYHCKWGVAALAIAILGCQKMRSE
jgi:hypothetical protein